MLKFRHSAFGYQQPLYQIDELELEAGKVYALIGRNGSGKTTFLRTLLGMHDLLSGAIHLNEQDLTAINSKERAKLMAFVASRFDGVQHLLASEYVALGRAPYTNFLGVLSEADHQLTDNLFAQLGIESLKNRDTITLSDGERQLLSIARAMAQEAPLLLLDEPGAFLDYPNRLLIMRLLRELAAETQKLIIYSSHELELCLEFADELLLVNPGQLQCISPKGMSRDDLLLMF